MKRWSTIMLIAFGLIPVCGLVANADEPASAITPAKAGSADTDAIQDILYLSPRQPLLIRLHLFVKGEGFRELRRKWADSQFVELDGDQNGVLEGDELKRIPAPDLVQPGIPRDAMMSTADFDPADGKVTKEEFRRYLMATTATPFTIVSTDNQNRRVFFNPNNNNAQVNLFPKLDTNQDGKLSRQEIEATAANLKRYDRNEDDLVDSGELQQTLPEETAMARQQLAGTLGLLLVVDLADGGYATSRRLLELYDKSSRDPVSKVFRKDEKLSQTELPIEPDAFSRADLNGDGKLDRKELGRLPFQMTPSVELEIQAPSADERFSIVLLRPVDQAIKSLIDVQSEEAGFKSLKVNETSFALRAVGNPAVSNETQIRDLYKQQFANLDQNKNDYLEPNEMRNFGFSDSFFAKADSDSDGKVFEKEYLAQIDREIGLSKSGFTWEVSSDGPSLFRMIDTNPADGRLSLRELSDVASKFSQLDANADGMISLNELSIQLEAVFKAGVPRVNGPFNIAQQNNGMNNAPQRSTTAPEWFTKMDRNRDGDLSPKEFLGRRVLFNKIDKNRDGLISVDEATAATNEAAAAKADATAAP